MKKIRTGVQRALSCRCGRGKVIALGMCATCYTLKRQDEEYFGGLREQVLKRDGYCCRVCGASGRGKRSIVVHHRTPGVSKMALMISLCPACHAIVSRTQVMRRPMPPLLLELWREQHPSGHEQTILCFETPGPVAIAVPLFTDQTSSQLKAAHFQLRDKRTLLSAQRNPRVLECDPLIILFRRITLVSRTGPSYSRSHAHTVPVESDPPLSCFRFEKFRG